MSTYQSASIKTMQDALPYKTWLTIAIETPVPRSSSSKMDRRDGGSIEGANSGVKNMVLENAVIVFGRRGCCMGHVVKRLLHVVGVNPLVYDVDEDNEKSLVEELEMIGAGDGKDGRMQLPAVFIGGRLFGGLDRLMATHITGELTPILKQAGALWL